MDSYEFLDRWVIQALHDLGVGASYEPINDLVSLGGKIGGMVKYAWPTAPCCTT